MLTLETKKDLKLIITALDKEKQNHPKVRRKKIIKVRAEINDIKNRKIDKDEIKSQFFEKGHCNQQITTEKDKTTQITNTAAIMKQGLSLKTRQNTITLPKPGKGSTKQTSKNYNTSLIPTP